MERPFTYISNPMVKRLLKVENSVALAEETLMDHYNGEVEWSAPRQTELAISGVPTRYKFKGCVIRRLGVAGFRLLALNRTPSGYSIAGERPTKHVLLSDFKTGEFFAIVDEHWSHAIRTGACAAVATKYLMIPSTTAVAVVGTGYMAYCAILALNCVMSLDLVRVWSRSAERRQAFAKRVSAELGIDVEAAATAEACVKDMKAVVTVTHAPKPFLKKKWFAPGVFIYAMGNFQEVDLDTYLNMTFMADERDQIKVCPDIARIMEQGIFSDDHVEADLPEIVGDPSKRRQNNDQQIILRSQGLVTQDVAQAYWIFKQAIARNVRVDLEPFIAEQAGNPLF